MKVKSEREVAQSCLTLSDPMDCSLPGSSIHGIFRQEYWSGLPLPSPKVVPRTTHSKYNIGVEGGGEYERAMKENKGIEKFQNIRKNSRVEIME